MPIRIARREDVPGLVVMAAQHHAKSHWAGLVDFDAESAARMTISMIESADTLAVISETDGRITGFIGIITMPLYFNTAARLAQELCWYCEDPRAAFRLVQAAETWARATGAKALMLGSQHGTHNDQIRRVYARKGFVPFSSSFMKRF